MKDRSRADLPWALLWGCGRERVRMMGSVYVLLVGKLMDKMIPNYHIMLRTEGNLEEKACSDGYVISVIDALCWIKWPGLDIFCSILESQQVTANTHLIHVRGQLWGLKIDCEITWPSECHLQEDRAIAHCYTLMPRTRQINRRGMSGWSQHKPVLKTVETFI